MDVRYYLGTRELLRLPTNSLRLPRVGDTVQLLDIHGHRIAECTWQVVAVCHLHVVQATLPPDDGPALYRTLGWPGEIRVSLAPMPEPSTNKEP